MTAGLDADDMAWSVCEVEGEAEDEGAGLDLTDSRKHFEHMFMVEGEPKNPQPLAHGGGDDVPCRELPC